MNIKLHHFRIYVTREDIIIKAVPAENIVPEKDIKINKETEEIQNDTLEETNANDDSNEWSEVIP